MGFGARIAATQRKPAIPQPKLRAIVALHFAFRSASHLEPEEYTVEGTIVTHTAITNTTAITLAQIENRLDM